MNIQPPCKKWFNVVFYSALLFFQSSAWSATPDDCLDPVHSLPNGSYLNTLIERCEGRDLDLASCVASKVSYDPKRDILTSLEFSTPWLDDDIHYHLPVVLNNACHWVKKGFDITLASHTVPLGTNSNDASTPLYSGFLLVPASAYYIPVLSEIKDFGTCIRREKGVAKVEASLKGKCTDVSWYHFNQDLTASCQINKGEEYQSLTLSNAFSCLAEELDIVFVSGVLFCLNTEQSMAIAYGKTFSNELKVVNSDHSYMLRDLITHPDLTDQQLLEIMKALNAYMFSVDRHNYIGDMEAAAKTKRFSIRFLEYYFSRSIISCFSPKTALNMIFQFGVPGEIFRAGGEYSFYMDTYIAIVSGVIAGTCSALLIMCLKGPVRLYKK